MAQVALEQSHEILVFQAEEIVLGNPRMTSRVKVETLDYIISQLVERYGRDWDLVVNNEAH